MRRYGEPVRSDIRYAPRPGVYAILPRGERLLVTHQSVPRPEFQLPGGGVDPGEPPLRALAREVFEETGWRIAAPRRAGAYRRFVYMPEYARWAEKICTIYVARPVRCHGPAREAGHSAHWLDLRSAPDWLGSPGDAAVLRDLLGISRSRPRSRTGAR